MTSIRTRKPVVLSKAGQEFILHHWKKNGWRMATAINLANP